MKRNTKRREAVGQTKHLGSHAAETETGGGGGGAFIAFRQRFFKAVFGSARYVRMYEGAPIFTERRVFVNLFSLPIPIFFPLPLAATLDRIISAVVNPFPTQARMYLHVHAIVFDAVGLQTRPKTGARCR